MNLARAMQISNVGPYKISKETGVGYTRVKEIMSGQEGSIIELIALSKKLDINLDLSKGIPKELQGVPFKVLDRTKKYIERGIKYVN